MEALANTNKKSFSAALNRWVLATGLTVIGASKFVLPFDAEAADGTLLPVWLLVAVGVAECAVAGWLLRRPGFASAAVALGMSLLFLGSTVVLTSTMSELDTCGCFGPWRASAGVHLATAFGLVVLSVAEFLEATRRRGVTATEAATATTTS